MSCLNIISHYHIKYVSFVIKINILNLLKIFIIMLQILRFKMEKRLSIIEETKQFHSFNSNALHEYYKCVFCIVKINL